MCLQNKKICVAGAKGAWGETGKGGRGQVEEGPIVEDSGFYST